MDGLIASENGLVIRRMRDEPAEYERIVQWQNQPHVREWWNPDDPPLSPDETQRQYEALTRADSTTIACVFEFEGRAAGYIQFYPWGPYQEEADEMGFPAVEDAWGLDVFVGEPDLIDRGVGSALVDLLSLFLFDECGASRVMFAAAVDNGRALRAYEKAGFTREGRVLDTDVKDGQRVASWLLVRRRPLPI